jgi:hypothetical protein
MESKVKCHIYVNPSYFPIVNQIKPVQALPSYLWSILMLFSYLLLGILSGSFMFLHQTV